MTHYCFAGQEVLLSTVLPNLNLYQLTDAALSTAPVTMTKSERLIGKSTGWVARKDRSVEVWSAGAGLVLKVADFRDLFIAAGGKAILPVNGSPELKPPEEEVVLGPALVLALALGGKWSLHASAASFQNQGVVFLGESGYGKSTLAAYLDETGKPGWQRFADDILPVTLGEGGLTGWPHFPQLKLPTDEQPGFFIPDKISLDRIFQIAPINSLKSVIIERLSTNAAVKVLLGQIAGARLFTPALIAENLAFCAHAAQQVSVYRLSYPHRRDILPIVRELLEQSLKVDFPIENKLSINLDEDK